MRPFLMLMLAICFAQSEPSRSEDANAASIREALQLFSLVGRDPEMMNGHLNARPCEYPQTWRQYVIPEEMARAELGTNIHADVVGTVPASASDLKNFLKRDGDDLSAFCSDEKAKSTDMAQIDALASSESDSTMIYHSAFSYPVFDADYRKAILVGMHFVQLFKRTAGGVKKSAPVIVIFATIFEKTGDGWRKIRTEVLGQT